MTLNNLHEIGGENKDQGNYVCNYFQLPANQELTTLNFCIALSTLVTRNLGAPFHEGLDIAFPGIALGLLLTMFSLVFWRLDERNTELIHHGEDARKHCKNSATSHRRSQTQAVILLGTENGLRRLSS